MPEGDAQSAQATLVGAQVNLLTVESQVAVQEVVADKGYHDNGWLSFCRGFGVRTYIPERNSGAQTETPELDGQT